MEGIDSYEDLYPDKPNHRNEPTSKRWDLISAHLSSLSQGKAELQQEVDSLRTKLSRYEKALVEIRDHDHRTTGNCHPLGNGFVINGRVQGHRCCSQIAADALDSGKHEKNS